MHSSNFDFQDFDLGSPSDKDSHSIDLKSPDDSPFRSIPNDDRENVPKVSREAFWTFQYYQKFFDVTTDEVKSRIIWSMIPRPGKNYLNNYIKPNPDLYGPIWICTTLVFTIAVSGNVANYLQYAPEGNYFWKYDFHLVSNAASAIFSYTFMVPLILFTFMTWNNSMVMVTFLELLCAYGYSLAIYVPVSILWVIQIAWFQWTLVLVAAALSGYVLVTTVGPSIEGPKKIPAVLFVIGLHLLLAIGFMVLIFKMPDHPLIVPTTSSPVVHVNTTSVVPKA